MDDETWQIAVSLYLSLRDSLIGVWFDAPDYYSGSGLGVKFHISPYYSGNIGNKFSYWNTANATFNSTIPNSNNVSHLGYLYLPLSSWSWPNYYAYSEKFNNKHSPAYFSTAGLYEKKQRIYPSAYVNQSVPPSQSDAEQEVYAQTGLCSLANDLHNLMREVHRTDNLEHQTPAKPFESYTGVSAKL